MHLGLIGHLVQVHIELSQLGLQLPHGGGDELLRSKTLAVSSLQKSMSLLQAVLHGSCNAVIGDLGVSIGRLEGVLLDGGLRLCVAGNSMLKSKSKISSVFFKFLLHPVSLRLVPGLSLEVSLHGVQGLGLGLLLKQELFLLLGQAALNLLPDGIKLQLAPHHLALLLLVASASSRAD